MIFGCGDNRKSCFKTWLLRYRLSGKVIKYPNSTNYIYSFNLKSIIIMKICYLISIAITCLFASCTISEDVTMISKKRATYSFKVKIQQEYIGMMSSASGNEGVAMFSEGMAQVAKAHQTEELKLIMEKYSIADPYVVLDLEKGIFEYSFSFD